MTLEPYDSITETDLLEQSLREIDFHKILAIVAKKCVSFHGKESVNELRPFDDISITKFRLACVDELVRLQTTRGEEVPLPNLPDVRAAIKKSTISNACLQAAELLDIADVLALSRSVRNFFVQRDDLRTLATLADSLTEQRLVEKHIHDAIDSVGAVRDSASMELRRIRQSMFDVSAQIRQKLNRIIKRLSDEKQLNEEYISQRDGRFVIPLKDEFKRSIPGIFHGMSQTGSTVFIEPAEISEMNNELSILKSEEEREIINILTMLTSQVGAYAEDIERSESTLCLLDVLQAIAKYAVEVGGILPTVCDEDVLELTATKHPLLCATLGKERVIPVSISFDEKTRGFLISGPNAGGKTVTLKTIGLSVAMALSGIFPIGACSTGHRRVFVGIGDHQSIEANLSTFSSQLTRLRDIISFSGIGAIVLVDEICSGTDPAEGSAIAAGIMDSLIERRSLFVVTTHQSTLKSYAFSRPELSNASMEFDSDRLVPTYRFLPGVPGNSYAFALAKKIGLQEVVLKRSLEFLDTKHSVVEKSIEELQLYSQKIRTEEEHARATSISANKMKQEFEEKLQALKEQRNGILRLANEEAKTIVENANALIENTIRKVKEDVARAGDARREFEEGKQEIQKKVKHFSSTQATGEEQLIAGDTVSIKGSSGSGTVVSVDEDSNQVLVEFNGLKFRVQLNQLEKNRSKAKIAKSYESTSRVVLKFDARTSIDVRGYRPTEVVVEVDKFLNDALIANITPLTIIHGKGTGALRVTLHDYLKKNDSVLEYREGSIDEGGAGVTVLHLR